MEDKLTRSALRAIFLLGSASALSFAHAANAGEVVLYGEMPDWVHDVSLDRSEIEDGPSALVYDWQHRLEDGVVTSYTDAVTRIDNPQSAMEAGTISLSWLPDKGDLTIHRVEIMREGTTIDVVSGQSEFEVLRREQGLERRLLDGQLTATLAIPGLQVGDVLRITHSITTEDQALGDEMQVLQQLWTRPWQVGFARTIVSWPEDEQVYWSAEDHARLGEPVLEDGYRTLEVILPLAEMPDMPHDAPSRFTRSPVLRVGTYESWSELSRTMQPHFAKAAQVAPDSEVAAQARDIMDRTSDPRERTALAVRLVQDEISYLLNGLDGGNYLPQSAEDTWAKRYGDCKAKSVLLHALLTRMGIESQTVLVSTRGGDAIPELLPIPGNFDHMIVRAKIDGMDYWLDGTSTATRLTNLAEVPPFHYALPLTREGADLVAMTQRDKPWPDVEMQAVSDYSAGLDLPAPFELTITMYGPAGASLRKAVDEVNEDSLRQIGKSFTSNSGEGSAISSVQIDYDTEAAAGTISIRGIAPSEFEWDDGKLVLDPDLAPDSAFDANRAKPEWRNIPVATAGPSRSRISGRLLLPEEVSGFVYDGAGRIDADFANTRIVGSTTLETNALVGETEVFQALGEVSSDRLPEIKREVRRLTSEQNRLIAPADVRWRWELDREELGRRVATLREVYADAIAFADDDDYGPRSERATFLAQIFFFEEALADLNILVEEDTSAWVLNRRAGVLRSLGRQEDAIEDLERSYDLEPEIGTALLLAENMAYAGRAGDALELLETLPVTDSDSGSYSNIYSIVAGLAGRTDLAMTKLAEEASENATDGWVLNADCWYRGLFEQALETALDVCTRAIERADNSAAILDSRALVHYRLGDHAAAIADLDSALELNPAQSASYYLRGLVRLARGDRGGRQDIAIGLRMSPELADTYARHGLGPV